MPIGIDGLRAVAAVSRYPVAAIGGISTATIDAVLASGVAMAAVIAAIASAPDPESAARALVEQWYDRDA